MILVRYIDVIPWKRWRHERLRRIWRAIDQYNSEPGQLQILPYRNPGRLTHGECLNNIYQNARTNPDVDILIITEQDFLPESAESDWIWRMEEDLRAIKEPVLAPVRQRTNKGDTAPFLMAFKLDEPEGLCGVSLEFDHDRDPAADLHEQVPVKHFTGTLNPKVHDGWDYVYGTHLLYQRHLHDPVDMRCGHVILGEMQRRHDRFVEKWICQQSHTFRRIYESFEISQ